MSGPIISHRVTVFTRDDVDDTVYLSAGVWYNGAMDAFPFTGSLLEVVDLPGVMVDRKAPWEKGYPLVGVSPLRHLVQRSSLLLVLDVCAFGGGSTDRAFGKTVWIRVLFDGLPCWFCWNVACRRVVVAGS